MKADNLKSIFNEFDHQSNHVSHSELNLEQMKSSLSDTGLKYLQLAAKTMIFIVALRFLTDYLNNNMYYKIDYPEHNLDSAKNQFKLI